MNCDYNQPIKEGNPNGRPPLFKTPEELEKRIQEYHEWIRENKKPYTLERLAVFLGCDIRTVRNYDKRDGFFPILKKVRDFILAEKIERLHTTAHPTGVIFDMKCNHKAQGYRDTVRTENVDIDIDGDSIELK